MARATRADIISELLAKSEQAMQEAEKNHAEYMAKTEPMLLRQYDRAIGKAQGLNEAVKILIDWEI